jgi:flagellar biosynthesis protein FliQ
VDTDTVLRVAHEALMLTLLVSGPPALAALLVALVVTILQAATQIQDHTLTAVPKIAAVFAVLAFAGAWMVRQAVVFGQTLLEAIAAVR